ncbi:MAG: OmpA family protein [Flavobacteriales bacterium]|nr:OmpA family protein [Flavobacteriales bacterium]
MKKLLLFILLGVNFLLFGQEQKGDEYFQLHDYNAAIKAYLKALKKNENGTLHQKVGKAYLFAKDYNNADKHYNLSLTFDDQDDSTLFQYAKALLILNHKKEARKYFDVYSTKYPKDHLAKQYLKLYDSLLVDTQRKPDFSIQTLEGGINTELSEYGAKPHKNGLLYLSEKSPDLVNDQHNTLVNSNYFGIYYSENSGVGNFYNNKLNSPWNNGSVVLSPDGSKLYFTKTFRNRKTEVMQLFYCNIEGDKLSKPIPFEYNNKEYSILHPAFSEDGKTLYFSSNKKGGKGGWDIYYSKKDRKYGWLAPKPINGNINTAGNEVFPHAYKGNLYFSSDGHFGYGGLDLFKARANEYYKNIYNLGAPINSPKDDFSIFYTSQLNGYFSSDRPSGKGKDDIYQFTEIEHPIITDTATSISGVFQFKKIGLAQKELILYDENGIEVERIITDKDGNFVFNQLKPGVNYTILPAEEIEDADLFLTNSKGEKIILAQSDGKQFIFKTIKSDYAEALLPIEEEDPSFLIIPIKGFVYKTIKGDFNERIEIKVYDESGTLIGRTYTNKDGTFVFNTLTPQNNYFLEIAEEEELHIIIKSKNDTDEQAERQENGQFLFKRIKNNDDAILLVNENNDLIRIFQNERFSVNNILYETNSAELNIDAITELNKLYIMYKKNIHLTFTIESHTDSKGSDKYNLKLSEKRAKKVVEYLENKGIPKTHLIAKGLGETKLLNKCGNNDSCSDEEHAINRRTEIKLKGKKTEF